MEFSLSLVIIAITVLTSYLAFRDPLLKSKCLFYPYKVGHDHEFHRFITSGFIHADWMHLGVNMYVLYSFGDFVEKFMHYHFGGKASIVFILLYFGGMIVSDIPTFLKHRKNPHYAALGASGAVSAVVFASILFLPWKGGIGLIFIPGLTIPPIIFGLLYLMYSVYMARNSRDNINHDAHFYGAVFGLVFPVLLKPELFTLFVQQLKVLLT